MTSCNIIFRLWDVTAALEAQGDISDRQSFSKLSLLFKEDRLKDRYKRYGTLEKDQFLLDGKHRLFPDNPDSENFGLWSLSMSNENRMFANPPVLTVNFPNKHSSVGLTLHFDQHDEDYCEEIMIKWFQNGNQIGEQVYNLDSSIYFCENHIDNYDKVVITFVKTSKPYRYLKLQQIDFGFSIPLRPEDITSATLLEEVDPISSEISINTLDFTIYSKEQRFCVVNPKGIYKFLQKKQRVDIFENVDGQEVFMGCQYFDTAENESAEITNFNCIDAIGIIEQTNFNGGIYNNVLVSTILNDIVASAHSGIVFELDKDFASARVSGYIPICTNREALQQRAFAIGAVVDCSRAYEIKIYPAKTYKSQDISYSQKIDDHSVKQLELVTSVMVVAHEYSISNETTELFNGTLLSGVHEIIFSSPATNLSIIGGSIVSSNANMAKISVNSAGTVVIKGNAYNDNTTKHRKNLSSVPPNERGNEVSIESATLINKSNVDAVAQRVLDYYQNRLEGAGGIILKKEQLSELVDMKTMINQTIRGTIESLNINLTGGFIADVKVKGKAV